MNLSRFNEESLIEARQIPIEIYEIKISRYDFRFMLTCMCRVSFLTTLDIYIRLILKAVRDENTKRTYVKSDQMPYSL